MIKEWVDLILKKSNQMLNKHLKFELLIKKLYKYLSDDMAIRNNSEQSGNNEPFPVNNVPIYFLNSEQPCVS